MSARVKYDEKRSAQNLRLLGSTVSALTQRAVKGDVKPLVNYLVLSDKPLTLTAKDCNALAWLVEQFAPGKRGPHGPHKRKRKTMRRYSHEDVLAAAAEVVKCKRIWRKEHPGRTRVSPNRSNDLIKNVMHDRFPEISDADEEWWEIEGEIANELRHGEVAVRRKARAMAIEPLT
jgi:hypothetical protein